ncbi:MAG: hypothetical protein ABIG93_01205 [archaeon]|nr:hypothetical protein [Nanoarchaeota archaeon]
MKLTKKEKRDIGFIVGAVLVVGVIGLLLNFVTPSATNVAGQAITLDPDSPTYSGMLYLLENNCAWVASSGSTCDVACGDDVCIPLEETCSVAHTGNCRCCEVPE